MEILPTTPPICYLFFEPGKPEKFRSNVFAKVGYEKWKKALERFYKHATSYSHNNARLKCDDFMNQSPSMTQKIKNMVKRNNFDTFLLDIIFRYCKISH